MTQTITDTTKIYRDIRNTSFELIDNLNSIKDNLYLFNQNKDDFSTQIEKCIISYETLSAILIKESEFFNLINKTKDLSDITDNIKGIIVDIVNYEQNIDISTQIYRSSIEGFVIESHLFIKKIREYFVGNSDINNINNIDNILNSHSLILEENAINELFEFEFVYQTKHFVNYLMNVSVLLNLLKNSNLNNDLLMELFSLLSKIPSKQSLETLFS